MAKAFTIELNESEAKNLEALLDKTLDALRRLEADSQQRDARLDQKHERTMQRMTEIEERLEEIGNLNASRKMFSTDFVWQ